MRLFATMVTKDEADRYLRPMLSWLMPIVDGIAVFDDCSTDDTVAVARSHGVQVDVRDPHWTPSFLQNEGTFRQTAWGWFERALSPSTGDWVLAIDADEFLVADGKVRPAVDAAIRRAMAEQAWSLRVKVPEVFAVDVVDRVLTNPRVRTDGFWGSIAGTRIFRWEKDGKFRKRVMGCGSEPDYVSQRKIIDAPELDLVHLGYAMNDDLQAKFERYSKLDNHGHAEMHVQSIVAPPTLEPWTKSWPKVWR